MAGRSTVVLVVVQETGSFPHIDYRTGEGRFPLPAIEFARENSAVGGDGEGGIVEIPDEIKEVGEIPLTIDRKSV